MIRLLRTVNPDVDYVLAGEKYIECVATEIEEMQIYPRLDSYRDMVLLALLDKVLTTARAVVSLSRNGFAAEALGLSRTVIEAYFYMRYIANRDSEIRAKRYLDYFAKDRKNLVEMISKHHPSIGVDAYSEDHNSLMKRAEQFKSPHNWYIEPNLKAVALEKSTWAFDDKGEPISWEYAYDVVFRYASHEVHATSVALGERVSEFYENSKYPAPFKFSKRTKNLDADTALFNVCLHLRTAVEEVFHAFDMAIPVKVTGRFEDWLKETRHPSYY